jgi:hypothetical protein
MFARLALALTTRSPCAWELSETGLDRLAADLAREDWSVRFAAPKWDVVWSREWSAPLAQRVLVLPDPGHTGPGPYWQHLVHKRLRHRAEALA